MYTFLKFMPLIGVYFVYDMTIYLTLLSPKIQDNVKKSDLMGRLGIEFGAYIIVMLLASIFAFYKMWLLKGIIMFLFAVSPFIIGRFATYKTRYLFTILQFLVIILSAVYAFIEF